MRILHSADWHLGRLFWHHSLLEDQRVLLKQVLEYGMEYQPDVFILAGDIFDRANPPREAIDLFRDFLARFYAQTRAVIMLIAGNHDAGELIGYGGVLNDPSRVLVGGTLEQIAGRPLLLEKEGVSYALTALPFADIHTARHYFGDNELAGFHDVIAAQLREAAAHVPEGHRWIVASHCFAAGCSTSESERALTLVGGLETASAQLFEHTAYTALGHLHRPQAVGAYPHVRYAGSLMAYGFDETSQDKSVTLVDLPPEGNLQALSAEQLEQHVRHLPLRPPRQLRVLEGTFAEILAMEVPAMKEPEGHKPGGVPEEGERALCEDFIKVCLTDTQRIQDASARLRRVYPNLVQLEWPGLRQGDGGQVAQATGRRQGVRRPVELFARFYEDITATKLTPAQQKTVISHLEQEEQG